MTDWRFPRVLVHLLWQGGRGCACACGCAIAFAIVALAGVGAAAAPTADRPVLVAVASNFAEVAAVLTPLFEAAYPYDLQLSVGSTGKLYAQAMAGAPYDVLLAADQARPIRLEDAGVAAPGSRFTYAIGRLTLWSPDPARIGDDGPAALRAPDVRFIAMANPALAPYGMAAREVLRALGLDRAVKDKLVMGQNIGQTFSMVATGNAELGFVALSAVVSPRNRAPGSRWDVPQSLYAPIRQDAVLLTRDSPGAAAFLAFLKSGPARAVIARFGYGLAPE